MEAHLDRWARTFFKFKRPTLMFGAELIPSPLMLPYVLYRHNANSYDQHVKTYRVVRACRAMIEDYDGDARSLILSPPKQFIQYRKILPTTEVKAEPNIESWSPPIEIELTNPHMVTAEQLGLYINLKGEFVEMPAEWQDDIIDVEMHEVKENKNGRALQDLRVQGPEGSAVSEGDGNSVHSAGDAGLRGTDAADDPEGR